jgi:hypothetical protein
MIECRESGVGNGSMRGCHRDSSGLEKREYAGFRYIVLLDTGLDIVDLVDFGIIRCIGS